MRHAFAEAIGKNIANPTATLLSACNMLKHIHLDYHAKLIEDSVHKVIKTQKVGLHSKHSKTCLVSDDVFIIIARNGVK